jgi:hypothetical protein
LEGWGYRVKETGDVAAGLRTAMAWRPEAAVGSTDAPPSDGCEIGRALRGDVPSPSVPRRPCRFREDR